MAKDNRFHMHALTKGSAVHLHKAGHITAEHRNKIVKSAERGMKANPRMTKQPPQYDGGSPDDMADNALGQSAAPMQAPPPLPPMGKRR
jgi:hypothetical protein